MSEPKQIGIICIATKKYKQFVYNLLCGIAKNFLPEHNRTIFLFTDEIMKIESGVENVKLVQTKILPYPFPFATLYRYKIIFNNKHLFSEMDYLAYTDVDMDFVAPFEESLFETDLTFVYHPGFFSKRDVLGHWGSNGVAKESLAYVEPNLRKGYVAGGFNMGITNEFLRMATILSNGIEDDEKRGILAEHNDESHTNYYVKYMTDNLSVKYLTPSWCMVEESYKREAWGISDIPAYIIALSKDHKSIRE